MYSNGPLKENFYNLCNLRATQGAFGESSRGAIGLRKSVAAWNAHDTMTTGKTHRLNRPIAAQATNPLFFEFG